MQEQTINQLLWRALEPASRYGGYFPVAQCRVQQLGDGDTFFSVEKIQEFIKKYSAQCQKIAPVLKKSNLEATCQSIQGFLYRNFQYKVDTDTQQLYSPACAWKKREQGIDCKSFTIIAGCILHTLGITFYIRKIKQASHAPEQFSHVYVIIPKNQKTNDLNSGYFVIDGTLPQGKEVAGILATEDFLVMKHIGLNAPRVNYVCGYQPVGLSEPETPTAGSSSGKKPFKDTFVGNIFTALLDLGIERERAKMEAELIAARNASSERSAEMAERLAKENVDRILSRITSNNNTPATTPEKDNTLLYVGIGGGALLLVMMMMFMMMQTGNNGNKK